jgi:hypothetical protein
LYGNPFYARQLFDSFDVVQAEMIAFAHVGDDGHIATIERQACAENTAASRFQHYGIDRRVGQQLLCALRSAAIAGFQSPAVEKNTLGASHADFAASCRMMCESIAW